MQVKRRARRAPRFSGNSPWGERFAPYQWLTGSPCGLADRKLIAVIGTIGGLMALILPAACSARDAAQRVQSVNHLEPLGTARHTSHAHFGCLSSGRRPEATRRSISGRAVSLLPCVDDPVLYQRVDQGRPL
ncbi:MAG TPA: DUF1559 domain-containing protein, partial [Planctomycetaceae bacterium]|nr:DUF1559 domain-containing protein [Planctomycetaceae bacterium]